MSFNTKIDGHSLPHIYLKRVTLYPKQRAFLVKKGKKYEPVVWEEVHNRVLSLYDKLKELGVKKGDRVCIASSSCPEWIMADMAIL